MHAQPALKIDSHQHFLKYSRGDYGWITPDMVVLHRDYLPEDLDDFLWQDGIRKTVLVQAAPTAAESAFLLEQAERTPYVAGVVIWLNLDAPDFPRRLAEARRHPRFLGVRAQIELMPEADWLLREPVQAALAELEAQEVCLDLLITPHHFPTVLRVLERFPGLRAVVDHLGKPPIASGELQPWAEGMARLAAFPNVYCKLSGLITEAQPHHWRPEDLKPYIAHALAHFGPERLMFGSDWPTCLLAGSYHQAVRAVRDNLPDLTPEQLQAIFGGTAARFYRIA